MQNLLFDICEQNIHSYKSLQSWIKNELAIFLEQITLYELEQFPESSTLMQFTHPKLRWDATVNSQETQLSQNIILLHFEHEVDL